ncbi:MAG: DUF4363 family protein [Candidatus Scatovivens sp.]
MKMFKQTIIIIIVIVFVILLDIITNNITKKSIENISKKLDEIEDYIESDSKKSNEEAKKINDDWKKLEDKLSFYLEHDELEKVSININLLKKQIQIEEFEDAKESITEVKYLLKHIEEKQKLKVKNIF